LLFMTNIVAIVLGAAVAMFAVGIRRPRAGGARPWAKRVVLGLIFLANGLMIPLGYILYAQLPTEQVPVAVVSEMDGHIAHEGAERVDVQRVSDTDQGVEIVVTVAAPKSPRAGLARELAELAAAHYGRPVHVRVVTRLISDGRAGP